MRQGQEIDLLEELDGEMTAIEFKWKAKPNTKIPSSFLQAYNAKSLIIDRGNFGEFLLGNP